MLKKVLLAIALILIILALSIWYVLVYKGILFHTMPWLIPLAAVLGLATGSLRGIKHNAASQRPEYQADRHTIDSFLEHWGTAAGIFILIVSGFMLRAGYIRITSRNLHLLGLLATLFFGTYFLADFLVSKKYKHLLPGISDIIDGTVKKYLLRAAWEDTGKYQASQKSAFLVFLLLGFGILLTGAIKTATYYFGIPFQLLQVATQAHDIITGLFVAMTLIHILFSVIGRSHRLLLKSLFTGKA